MKSNWIVVAHPDDETLFFSSLILTMTRRPWKVFCVTDGDADGNGTLRRRQFSKACQSLGAESWEWMAYPDQYECRLPVEQIADELQKFPEPNAIYTHGPIGEYGHPHHQDVSYAVYRAFSEHPRVYASGYNAFPEKVVRLDHAQWELKAKILSEVYGSETRRFANLLPVTAVETFVRVSFSEVKRIYEHNIGKRKLKRSDLKVYRWYWHYLQECWQQDLPRPF